MSYTHKKDRANVISPPPSLATTVASFGGQTGGRDGDTSYVEDSRRIQDCIRNIQSSTSFISKLRDAGNPEGWANGSHQRDIHTQMTAAKKYALEAQSLLSRFGIITGGTPAEKSQRRLMHQKLLHNYQTALKALEEAAQKHVSSGAYASRELSPGRGDFFPGSHQSRQVSSKLYPRSSTSNSIWSTGSYMEENHGAYISKTDEYDGRPCGQDQQVRKHLIPIEVNSGELEEEMLKERQEGIRQIESDIQGIHDLYQELSFHVGAQGCDLDNIESQMRQAAMQTSNATVQVAIAQRYQRSRTWKMFILLAILAVGLVVVLLTLARIFHWQV